MHVIGFLFYEICVTKFSSPEGNESSNSIFTPRNRPEFEEKHFFMPENVSFASYAFS